MSLLDDVSIVVTPNGYKASKLYAVIPSNGDADMDVTRATAATRVDENGLVNYAEVLGGDLASDGDFLLTGTQAENTTGTYWNTGASWSIASGVASCEGTQTSGTYLGQTGLTFTNAKTYKVTYTVTVSAGNISARLQGGGATVTGTSRTSSGTYTDYLVSTGNTSFRMRGNTDFVGTVTNISIKELTRDNVPRIDYTGGGCPHILSEPMRTNLIEYSEDFSQSYWTETDASVSLSTTTSPDGLATSYKLIPDDGTGGNRSIGKSFIGLSNNHTHTCFAKKGEYNYLMLRMRNSPNVGVMFDLENGTLNLNNPGAPYVDSEIESIGNGWYKCSITLDPSQSGTSGQLFISMSVGITGSETNSFSGDGTSGIYIWGCGLEEGSYPTSYIPNFGTSAGVTRNQDIFTRDGIGSLINSTEGVLFVEIAALSDDGTERYISLSDGSLSNRVYIQFTTTTNQIKMGVTKGGSTQASRPETVSDVTEFNKLAISYSQDLFKFYVNGSLVFTDSSGDTFTANTLNRLNFDVGTSGFSKFFGKVRNLQVYKTALTEDQLEDLTS